ncbi:hypothetical protein O1L60_32670 [Streptomyces diastatochromogenes]|nr:hypothetical protein [Streptomyces diastatochromogenes]
MLGADGGRDVRREGRDGVEAVGLVEPVEQRPAVDEEVVVGWPPPVGSAGTRARSCTGPA